MSLGVVVALAALAVVLLAVAVAYNRLVSRRNGVDNAFATVDVQLKQRCDLIPNIVEAVRGYMSHERGVLERLTALRGQAVAAGVSPAQRFVLDGQMAGLLGGLVARVEAYPELKASETVLMLQRSLNEVEAQIAAARRTYNAAVTEYNTAIGTVPANVVAAAFGFGRRTFFEAAAGDRQPPPAAVAPR
jgi:LemA protein